MAGGISGMERNREVVVFHKVDVFLPAIGGYAPRETVFQFQCHAQREAVTYKHVHQQTEV